MTVRAPPASLANTSPKQHPPPAFPARKDTFPTNLHPPSVHPAHADFTAPPPPNPPATLVLKARTTINSIPQILRPVSTAPPAVRPLPRVVLLQQVPPLRRVNRVPSVSSTQPVQFQLRPVNVRRVQRVHRRLEVLLPVPTYATIVVLGNSKPIPQ